MLYRRCATNFISAGDMCQLITTLIFFNPELMRLKEISTRRLLSNTGGDVRLIENLLPLLMTSLKL
jgi:hypothetical protein